jgi:hypothetical protein
MIFDGLVQVYGSCRDCRQIMQVTTCGDTVHPNCQPKPTKVESLAQGWLSAVLADDTEAADLTEKEIIELDARPPRLLDAALVYASWGWKVFPLWPTGHQIFNRRTGETTIATGKEPATTHGFKDATTDSVDIRNWWSKTFPNNCNIGLATGHLFDVIDVDPDKGGAQSLYEQLAVQHHSTRKIKPCHGLVSTSSAGLHLYVKATGKGNFAGLYPGIDYRGLGGYVVAPPSTRGLHRAWSWSTAPSPSIKKGNTS